MRTFKRLLIAFILLVLVLVGTLTFNSVRFESKQLSFDSIRQPVLPAKALEHFTQSLTIQTVSHENSADFDSSQFEQFATFLAVTYPLADSLLQKQVFNDYSFLYQWIGADKTLKPIVLMAHLDVVPVIEENLSDWRVPPFAGEIREDTIWGRGAIDDKVAVIGILEAVEQMLKEGYKPNRTIYLAFGHDEEIGGRDGAQAVAASLVSRGIKAEFVLDEGGSIVQGLVPDIQQDVALIGTAEKGFVTLKLSVKLEGGHSSMPEKETAIDVLARAVVRLKEHPFPTGISVPVQGFIDYLGPEMPLLNKLVFANSGLFEGVITGIYEQSASGSALVRTTTSPTIFNSGVKENIIPQTAIASVNFRIQPETSIEDVIAHVKQTMDDERVAIFIGDFSSESSPVSGTDTYGFKTIHKTIAQIYPGALVAPYLVVGATDSRHFQEVSDQIYRFSPIKINKQNIKSFHGVNERLPVSEFENVFAFYTQLIKNATE